MIVDEKTQGYNEAIIALAYGLPIEAFNILLREQEEQEAYEFCQGMVLALKDWNAKKDGLNCRAILQDEES